MLARLEEVNESVPEDEISEMLQVVMVVVEWRHS